MKAYANEIAHAVRASGAARELDLLLRCSFVPELFKGLDKKRARDKRDLDAVCNFEYGPNDAKNKAVEINATFLTSNACLKGTASSKWCLLRFLPLILGDRIPVGNKDWELLLQYREIVDIVFAPEIPAERLAYLDVLVQSFLTDFAERYGPSTVTPKLHYMVHYGRWDFPFSWEPHIFVHLPRRRCSKPSSPVVRPPTTLASSRRRVASVFAMDVQVAGQDISPEEVTAQSSWLTARSRPSKRGTDNSTATDESFRAPSGLHSTASDGGYQDCHCPKGALHIAKIGSPAVTAAILQAAKLTGEESLEDTVCPNTQQNIVVVSPPHSDHADRYARISSIQVNGVTHEVNAYETAAEHTTKGVIRGIPLTKTPQQIRNKIVTARNPTALAAKRIASTTTVIIVFDEPDLPFQIRYGSTLLTCSLYRKQIDICYQCGHLGHRVGVCTYLNNKMCRDCGARSPPADHNCNLRTSNQPSHLSTSRPLHPPRQTQVTLPNTVKGEPFPLENSISIQATTLKIPVCIGSRITSTNKNKVSFAGALNGTSREGRKITNRHAPSRPPSPDNPEIADLMRENVILRDLLTKLTQEVRDL
ncbi:hypothetical protein HPB49_006526 [Dermacentor silvarum]|uniref:Uncharacterized protein n=1 Tax=Dermacentor silvarum TaxID=543639 RepID=A0ACB8C7Y0_DERSI|nr:hypothetical protein HPB49_006526 [Dermacentor silvarum]